MVDQPESVKLHIYRYDNGWKDIGYPYTCNADAHVPAGGTISCSLNYTLTQADIDSGWISEAYDFRTMNSEYVGNLETGQKSFGPFEAPSEPETPTPAACHAPEGGNRFVFRYRSGVLPC
jgi:hypothetical protein